MDGRFLLTAITDNDLATIKANRIDPFTKFKLSEIYDEEPSNLVADDYYNVFYFVMSSVYFEDILEWFLSCCCLMTIERKDWEGSIYHGAKNRKVKKNPVYLDNDLKYRKETREINFKKLNLFHSKHPYRCRCRSCNSNPKTVKSFERLGSNLLKFPFLSTISAFDEIRKNLAILEDLDNTVRGRIKCRILWQRSRTFCVGLVLLPIIDDVRLHIANIALSL